MDHIEISEGYREGLRCLRFIRDAGPETREYFSQFLNSNTELFRIKDDNVFAVGTGDMVITLEPSERLRELMAAVRAWKAERDLVQQA
ncbi:MAG: hypothetical protein LAP40_26725 [Acidobacteriia bacterium]|nr:hypothetical protein [Terriglobia bacterium]